MIISGGVNIYPQETENLLSTHPAVLDVAVIGVPNEDLGEEVKAVVQPVDPARAGPELAQELIAFCRAHLAHFKCPRSVDFVDELPRLPTGKLYKRLVRDRYWAGHQTVHPVARRPSSRRPSRWTGPGARCGNEHAHVLWSHGDSSALARVRSWLERRTPARTSRHRDVQDNAARAAVLGAGDGLITNVSLILGVAGASTNASAVRLVGHRRPAGRGVLDGRRRAGVGAGPARAGGAGAPGGAGGAGGRARGRAAGAGRHVPGSGRAAQDADTVARILCPTPAWPSTPTPAWSSASIPTRPGRPATPRVASFLAFGVGALLPLLPWFFTGGTAAVIASIIIGAAAALVLGAVIGAPDRAGRGPHRLRQLAVGDGGGRRDLRRRLLLGVSTS